MKKSLFIAFVSVVLLLALVTGCKQDPDPQPVTVTKKVTVTFPAFTQESATLDLTPTYTPTGGWGDFASDDITYVISDDKGHSSATGDFTGKVVSASLYSMSNVIKFTQTFTHGSSTSSQSFITNVISSGGLKFEAIYDNDTNYIDLGTTIPPVTLYLSKDITGRRGGT
jgi:hypothetical protein